MARAVEERDRWCPCAASSAPNSEKTVKQSPSLQNGDSEEEDPILDALLAYSSLALQSAQRALQESFSDRKRLAHHRANANALELLMGRREVELLARLEANRQMAADAQQRTSELQALLRSSRPASIPCTSRRNASYSSSTGGWKVGAATGVATVEDGNGSAAQFSGFGFGIEGGVTGIVEASHDQGVTMGKSAARRLEKMLERQAVHRASHSILPPAPYSPQSAQGSNHLSERRNSSISTVTAASFATASSASLLAKSDVCGERMEEPLDDAASSRIRTLDTPISPSLSSSTSPSFPWPSCPASYFARASTTSAPEYSSSSSRSTSPTSALPNRRQRQRLHGSHPSAPAVISVGSTTTAASSIWSPGYFTTDAWDPAADPLATDQRMRITPAAASASAAASAMVALTRASHPQR